MKHILCLGACILIAGTSMAHSGETRVFISANPPSKSGVDQCLANSEKCGAPAAQAFCQSREFSQVKAYRRVDPDEVTGSVPKTEGEGCPAGGCSEYVAIICQR